MSSMEKRKVGYKWLQFLVMIFLTTGIANRTAAQLTQDENLSRFDDRQLHFGFYLGINTMDYRFSHYNNVMLNPVFADPALLAKANDYYNNVHNYRVDIASLSPGFTVGGVLNLRINEIADFRFTPGMSLGVRKLKFTENISSIMQDPAYGGKLYSSVTNLESYLTTPSAYIDFPVGVRYKGKRFGNVRPWIYGGAAYRRDLENKRISESVFHLSRNGYYAEAAFGLDTYFPYFRFSGELKFSYGLNNIILHDADVSSSTPLPYYGYVLKKLNSNIVTLIIYFE